jgi:sporulation protein YlmC with PRC-barrel domain
MKKKVVDSSNKHVGTVNDFIVTYTDNNVGLKSVVLGGKRVEEFMESIGLRPDDDPVFEMDCISQIQDDVTIKTDVKTLRRTVEKGTISDNDMRLSQLSKLPIHDSEGERVGHVVDVWFDINGAPWLVAGGGVFQSAMKRVGIQPDLDLLVPMGYVEKISKKEIKLKYTRFQLDAKCEDEYAKYRREIGSRHEPEDARAASMKFAPKPQGLMGT